MKFFLKIGEEIHHSYNQNSLPLSCLPYVHEDGTDRQDGYKRELPYGSTNGKDKHSCGVD